MNQDCDLIQSPQGIEKRIDVGKIIHKGGNQDGTRA